MIRTLQMQHHAHYISTDGGVHHKFGKVMFMQSQAPVAEPSSPERMMVVSVALNAFIREQAKYVAELIAWKVYAVYCPGLHRQHHFVQF